MAVRSSGLQRSPPFPTPQHLHIWSVTPPCRGLMLPPPGLWPPSPLSWQDPCPLHLSLTLPPASRQAPPNHSPLKSGTPFLKQGCLNPLISLHLSGLECPPRRSPHSPSPSLALSAGSPSCSLTSPAFQPSPLQFPPYLSHKRHFRKSLFPTPLRPPAHRPRAVQAPVYAVRHESVSSTCPRGLKQGLGLTGWVLGPEKAPTGRADFTTGRREERRDPGITDLELSGLRTPWVPRGAGEG